MSQAIVELGENEGFLKSIIKKKPLNRISPVHNISCLYSPKQKIVRFHAQKQFEKSHVIDIFTSEDMENISLCSISISLSIFHIYIYIYIYTVYMNLRLELDNWILYLSLLQLCGGIAYSCMFDSCQNAYRCIFCNCSWLGQRTVYNFYIWNFHLQNLSTLIQSSAMPKNTDLKININTTSRNGYSYNDFS